MRITRLASFAAVAATAAVLGLAAPAGASNGVTAVTHSAHHADTTNVAGPATQPSGNGPVWAYDNLEEHFTAVPVTGQVDGANWAVTIEVTGSFAGFADPTTGQALTSNGPVKGTIEYDVYSPAGPNKANLPAQEPDTVGLGGALNQLFGGSATIVGGGNYLFSYQNGNYVQESPCGVAVATDCPTGISGDVR